MEGTSLPMDLQLQPTMDRGPPSVITFMVSVHRSGVVKRPPPSHQHSSQSSASPGQGGLLAEGWRWGMEGTRHLQGTESLAVGGGRGANAEQSQDGRRHRRGSQRLQ